MKTIRTYLAACMAVLLTTFVQAQQGETPLRSGEALRISVTGVPQTDMAVFASAVFNVSNAGTVNLPHLGELKASGLTPSSLSKSIEAAYKNAQIYTKPVVNISRGGTGDSASQQVVTVSGNVKASGPVMWRPNLRLIEAISEKGGFDDFANKAKVKLIRGSKETVYDMRKIAETNNILLQPGDIVHVPQGGWIN